MDEIERQMTIISLFICKFGFDYEYFTDFLLIDCLRKLLFKSLIQIYLTWYLLNTFELCFMYFCAAFCLFYVVHGLLKELQYEIYVLILAILVVLVYCIIEYAVNIEGHTKIKEVMLFLFVVCWNRHHVRILIWYCSVKLRIETIFKWWKWCKMLLNYII